MKKTVIVFILGLCLSGGFYELSAQEVGLIRRVINNILFDTVASERPKFIAYPTIAYAPETRWEIGLSALLVYYAKQDTSNRLSEINAFTFITLEQQYGLWLDHALYSDQSQWFFLGRLRFQQFPLLYYGMGPDVTGEELARVDGVSINLKERILYNVYDALYIGLETEFQRLTNIGFSVLSSAEFDRPRGLEDFSTLGLGIGIVHDDRHNVLNVRKGFFGEMGFLNFNEAWGSDFDFTSYFLDARYYVPTTNNQVWASQFYFSHAEGNPPFNQLSLMGGESLMRGYYLGRYRDHTLMAAQTEYRFLPFSFSRRWGAAAFVGFGTVADRPVNIDLGKLRVAGGAGLRFLLFPNKDIFTRFDVAFTEDGPGYYFFIGEAF
mgnify:CR=1 FL=1